MKVLLVVEAVGFVSLFASSLCLQVFRHTVRRSLAREGTYEFEHAFTPVITLAGMLDGGVERSRGTLRAAWIYVVMVLSITAIIVSVVLQKTSGR